MMAPGHERGFGYLQNAAIRPALLARGRANDMAQVIAAHLGFLELRAAFAPSELAKLLAAGFILGAAEPLAYAFFIERFGSEWCALWRI
ncbi:MAG: hypothetical protein JO339_08300 [Alphaproteobacteria bacterium]|nr:hypothetical protein [Alphaproteobacteria bacterium]